MTESGSWPADLSMLNRRVQFPDSYRALARLAQRAEANDCKKVAQLANQSTGGSLQTGSVCGTSGEPPTRVFGSQIGINRLTLPIGQPVRRARSVAVIKKFAHCATRITIWHTLCPASDDTPGVVERGGC
jgi:hypothetical protein